MTDPTQNSLFDVDVVKLEAGPGALAHGRRPYPVRTARKAALIGEYLTAFVQVTKHGVYIDGFAGPHKPEYPATWAAKRAVDVGLLTEFHLHELEVGGVVALEALARGDDRVHVHPGDFNVTHQESLARVRDSQAAFCLFDQRTNECAWATVAGVADHKRGAQYKIELLYFFPQDWLNRSIRTTKAEASIARYDRWWGEPETWRGLVDLRPHQRGELVAARFQDEFGYSSVRAYPIEDVGRRLSYSLIHAADHPEARRLMDAAYRKVGAGSEHYDEERLPGFGI